MSANNSAIYDLQQTCRSCLCDSTEMVSLQRSHEEVAGRISDLFARKTIGQVMMECADVQLKCDDGLPQNICRQCISDLQSAFDYKKKCEDSDAKLRAFFQKHFSVAAVKAEKNDSKAEEVDVDHPLEEHWLDDGQSQNTSISENDVDGPMSDNEDNDMHKSSIVGDYIDDRTSITSSEEVTTYYDNDDEDVQIVARAQCVNGRWPCEICNKSLADPKTLKLHIRRHLGKKLKQCPVCDKSFAKQNHLNRHMRCHSDSRRRSSRQTMKKITKEEKTLSAKNERCQTSDIPTKLESISDTINNDAKDLLAIPTEDNKRNVGAIRGSVTRAIGDKNPVDDDEDLRIVARTQCVDGRWPCEFCKKTLADRKTLKHHVRLHLGKKLKRCPICDMGFSKQSHVEKHLRRHDPEPYRCRDCDEVFATKEARRQHQSEQHKSVDANLKNVDQTCADEADSLKFSTAAELDELVDSVKIENGKYACLVCERNFAERQTLRWHLILHNTTELKRCEICGEGFRMIDEFDKHMAWHKNGDMSEHDTKAENCSSVTLAEKNDSEIEECVDGDDEAMEMANRAETVNGRVKCEICERTLVDRKALKLHIRLHTGKNLHRCTLCQRGFSKRSHLQRHLISHEKKLKVTETGLEVRGNGKWPPITASAFEMLGHANAKKRCMCKLCYASFDRIAKLRAHIDSCSASNTLLKIDENTILNERYQITNSSGWELTLSDSETEADDDESLSNELNIAHIASHHIHKCGHCDESYNRRYKLIAHMNFDHSASDFERFHCTSCNQYYPNEEFLARHRRKQCENTRKKFTCKTCGVRFQWASSMEHHTSQKHPKKKFSCDSCDRVYQRYYDLILHKKNRHGTMPESDEIHNTIEKKFACDICQKKFARKDNLRTHMRVHMPKSTEYNTHDGYLCIYCGKSFRGSSNLTVHIRRHTGEKPFKCDHCDKTFPRNSDMLSHRRTHTGEKPHLCTLCGRAFSRSNKMSRHMRTHTGEKPYKCTFCGRGFSQSNDLTLHVRRHTGEKPYTCGICGERFYQNTMLNQHRRAHGHFEDESREPKLPHNSVNNIKRFCKENNGRASGRSRGQVAVPTVELSVSPEDHLSTHNTNSQ